MARRFHRGRSHQSRTCTNNLKVCGSFLEDIKLFNSNLQVIDEAFEYLSIKAGKGEKLQYFTPRHVIDMCVKCLIRRSMNLSSIPHRGLVALPFMRFSMFGVNATAKGPNKWQSDYAATHVYGLDFDPRSVKIAHTLTI